MSEDMAKVPTFLETYKEERRSGMEETRPQDVEMPRAVLAQALTPNVVNGNWQVGQVHLSTDPEVILVNIDPKSKVTTQLRVTPILFFRNYIRWGDRDSNEGMLEQEFVPGGKGEAACARGDKHENGKHVWTEYLNFMMLPWTESGEPLWNDTFIVACAKTNHKHGRRLNSMITKRGAPMWSCCFNFSSMVEQNAKNQQYYVFRFTNDGWIAENHVEMIRELHQRMVDMRSSIRVHMEGESAVDDTSGPIEPPSDDVPDL